MSDGRELFIPREPSHPDAAVLREAARILRRLLKKKKPGILMGALLNILRDTADKIDAAEEARRP